MQRTMTNSSALDLAARLKLRPATQSFPLERVNDALRAVEADTIDGSAVITMGDGAAA